MKAALLLLLSCIVVTFCEDAKTVYLAIDTDAKINSNNLGKTMKQLGDSIMPKVRKGKVNKEFTKLLRKVNAIVSRKNDSRETDLSAKDTSSDKVPNDALHDPKFKAFMENLFKGLSDSTMTFEADLEVLPEYIAHNQTAGNMPQFENSKITKENTDGNKINEIVSDALKFLIMDTKNTSFSFGSYLAGAIEKLTGFEEQSSKQSVMDKLYGILNGDGMKEKKCSSGETDEDKDCVNNGMEINVLNL